MQQTHKVTIIFYTTTRLQGLQIYIHAMLIMFCPSVDRRSKICACIFLPHVPVVLSFFIVQILLCEMGCPEVTATHCKPGRFTFAWLWWQEVCLYARKALHSGLKSPHRCGLNSNLKKSRTTAAGAAAKSNASAS